MFNLFCRLVHAVSKAIDYVADGMVSDTVENGRHVRYVRVMAGERADLSGLPPAGPRFVRIDLGPVDES